MEKKPLILVVDDDPLIRKALARDLKSDFEVLTADGNERALTIVASNKYLRGVLSDYHIGMIHTGVLLLSKIRRERPSIGRILVSGTIDEASVSHLIDNGIVHAFLSKPWTRVELVRTAKKFCHETV
jgi:response regulator RpfG family c-di-GMP phosphodiesterase